MSIGDARSDARRSLVAHNYWACGGAVALQVVGQGPAVLLVHGQPGSAADWALVVERLRAGHRVIVADRPGYGASPGPAVGIGANADTLVRVLDELGVGSATVVGHSWGGAVALAMAQRHPDRVDGLVLVASPAPQCPIGLLDRLLATRLVGSGLASVVLAVGGHAVESGRVQSRLARRFGPEAAACLAVSAATWRWRRVRASVLVEQRALLAELPGLASGLSAIAVPTTVVTGSADRVVPPSVARMLADAISGAQVVEVPGAGHALPVQAPSAIAGAVNRSLP